MAAQLISYDLRRPGQDYADLFSAIRALGSWCHALESTWIVNTALSAVQVRDRLGNHIDSNDKLMVASLSGSWASLALDKSATDWLRANL